MWIDDRGVAHTVALPDPTKVMADDFRAGLDALAHSDADALQRVIEDAEEQVYEAQALWLELDTSEEYVGAPPPVVLLRGQVRTPRDVAKAVDGINLRWRLDVIMALDDYLI